MNQPNETSSPASLHTAAQCNSPDIDQVMQAAERLRSVKTFGHRDVGYVHEKARDRYEAWCRDAHAVADACMPKGDIPRAMETPAHGQRVWYFDLCGDTVHESSIKVRNNMPLVCVYGSEDYWDTITPGGTPVFETEAAARLALHWQKFRELLALARWRHSGERL